MSLDTLLEAAEYIEWSAHSKPRDDDGSPGGEIRTFIKTETLADGDSSLDDSIGSQRGYGYADERKDRRRAGGAGTRETHNKLEKNRRAHLKECFDMLKVQIPFMEDKKTSNLSILRGALKFIQTLKRKEREFDKELHRLVSEKSRLRERLEELKVDLARLNMDVDLTKWMPSQEQDTNSTSTASGDGSPIVSDNDEEKEKKMAKKLKNSSKDKHPHISTQMIKSTAMPVIQPQPSLSTSKLPTHLGGTPTIPTMPTHIRAPVTQLLHQTLSKRQALQKQREQLAVSQVNTMNLNLPSASASQMNPILQQQLAFPVGGKPLPSAGILNANKQIQQTTKGLQMPMLLTAPDTTSSVTSLSTTAVSSPRLVPSSTAMAIVSTNHVSSISGIGPISALTGMTKTTSALVPCIGQPATTSAIVQPTTLKTTQLITTIVTPSITSLASMSAIKPILATPTTHFMTLNPLLAQLPRNSTLLTGVTTQAGTTPQPQLVSYAHMGTVTPMTMMPQGLQMAGFGNLVSSQQLLKQLPILQQPLLQQVQQGQVIGQPMVKPVVMVSLPNTVTSGTATLPLNITTTS